MAAASVFAIDSTHSPGVWRINLEMSRANDLMWSRVNWRGNWVVVGGSFNVT